MSASSISVGKELKNTRRELNWSIERAAFATKLKPDIIAKIEADRYDLLPNPAYARGFVRIYARELGLNPFPILRKLDGVVEDTVETNELRAETIEALPQKSRKYGANAQSIGLLIILLITAGGLITGGVQLYRIWPTVFGNQTVDLENIVKTVEDESAPETIGDEPVARAVPVNRINQRIQSIAQEENDLRLTAQEDCWARVTAIQGDEEMVIFEDVIPAGQSIPPAQDQPWKAHAFEMTLRETQSVDIIFNKQNLGHYDQPGHQTFRIPAN